MATKIAFAVLAASILAVGCSTPMPGYQQSTATTTTATTAPVATKAPAPQPSTPGARLVKSRNGAFEGEVFGNIAPNSRFAKLQIGMTMREVADTIGNADDMYRHETGKRWIPFYYGNDAQRVQTFYKGEGCLTFTGGNIFGGGGNELIRIMVAPKGGCMDS